MSLVPVGASTSQSSQSIGTQILQQLLSQGSGTQDANGLSGLLGDLLTLSPAAQQLQKAPTAVVEAMSDLFSSQKDVQGDLAKLKSYFQENPRQLTTLLGNLQGSGNTYGPAGATGINQALLATLLSGQANGSGTQNPVSLLMGLNSQESLFTIMDGGGSNPEGGPISLLG